MSVVLPHERRARPRLALVLNGLLSLEAQPPVAVRVVDGHLDATLGGLGLRHPQPLPKGGQRGRVFLHLSGGRVPRVVEAEVALCHSDFTRREFETGLSIVAISAVHRRLLEAALAGAAPVGEAARPPAVTD